MADAPSPGHREAGPATLPPRTVPRRSWVANVGQWVFAYTVAWSVFCTVALVPTVVGSEAGGVSALVAVVGWLLATVAAVATCDEPKEPHSAPRRYAVAIGMSLPGILIAVLAGLTVFLLPGLLILSVLGAPILPWLHRGSPYWQRAVLSVLGLAATAALIYSMTLSPLDWPSVEWWAVVLVLGPFVAAGVAIGALFALRTVGVPREVG